MMQQTPAPACQCARNSCASRSDHGSAPNRLSLLTQLQQGIRKDATVDAEERCQAALSAERQERSRRRDLEEQLEREAQRANKAEAKVQRLERELSEERKERRALEHEHERLDGAGGPMVKNLRKNWAMWQKNRGGGGGRGQDGVGPGGGGVGGCESLCLSQRSQRQRCRKTKIPRQGSFGFESQSDSDTARRARPKWPEWKEAASGSVQLTPAEGAGDPITTQMRSGSTGPFLSRAPWVRSSWLSLNNLASDRVKDKEREGVRAREDRTGKRGTRVKERTTAEHTKTRCSQVGRRGRVTERQRDRERQREREREKGMALCIAQARGIAGQTGRESRTGNWGSQAVTNQQWQVQKMSQDVCGLKTHRHQNHANTWRLLQVSNNKFC